jgi:hypothetical protein
LNAEQADQAPDNFELGFLDEVRRINTALEPAVEAHVHHAAQAVPVPGEEVLHGGRVPGPEPVGQPGGLGVGLGVAHTP